MHHSTSSITTKRYKDVEKITVYYKNVDIHHIKTVSTTQLARICIAATCNISSIENKLHLTS